jgi:hypothetical protein
VAGRVSGSVGRARADQQTPGRNRRRLACSDTMQNVINLNYVLLNVCARYHGVGIYGKAHVISVVGRGDMNIDLRSTFERYISRDAERVCWTCKKHLHLQEKRQQNKQQCRWMM